MSSALPKLPQLGWVAEFRAFILRGNVVDLAVGIIVGAAFISYSEHAKDKTPKLEAGAPAEVK